MLDYDLTKIDGHESLIVTDDDGTKRISALTETLIYRSLATGLGRDWHLDAEYAPEFYARLKLIEKLDGAMLRNGDGSDRLFTVEDVQRHIGLRVNVAPKTRAMFVKNVVGNRLDENKRHAEKVLREKQAA